MFFGAHMSISGGVWKAYERGVSIGCEVIQLFVKNNMQWFGKPYSPDDLASYANQMASGKLRCVFGHTGYLINIAAPASENREKSISSLVQEVQLATDLGLPFVVLHPGAHLKAGEEAGIELAAEALNEVFTKTKNSPVRIAFENTAGQGTCLGHVASHIGGIYSKVKRRERLAVCLDTAHFFASGHDIRTPEGWKKAIGSVDEAVGIDQIVAFHLNDSKTDLGSRVDRHAGIGEGKIGKEAFRHIVNDARFAEHPGCLETPKSEDLHEDVINLATLRSLVAGKSTKRGTKPKA